MNIDYQQYGGLWAMAMRLLRDEFSPTTSTTTWLFFSFLFFFLALTLPQRCKSEEQLLARVAQWQHFPYPLALMENRIFVLWMEVVTCSRDVARKRTSRNIRISNADNGYRLAWIS